MAIAPNPTYRNTRQNYYSDKASDTTEVGTIITTMKSVDNVHDNNFIPTTPSYNFTNGQITRLTSGDSQTEINPEYQYPGYLYCDGSEYKIEDYPALYTILGNDYGGEARPGMQLTNGGSGYPNTGMTITFTAPTGSEADKETIEATLTVVGGVVTAVSSTKLGKRYSSSPTFTLSNAGSGTGLAIEFNFNVDGQLQDIKQENVFTYLGETKSLGTFMLPDLKAKKILGYGNVYGSGTPTAGLLTTGAGAGKTGGKWLFDKSAQGGYFSLGSITTVDYEKVTDSVGASISGTQTVKTSMINKRLQDVPQHNHYVYHTSANNSIATMSAYTGDRYLVEYKNRNSRLYQWFPIGGLAYSHKHALLKQPLSDNTVATYDIMDFYPGAEGTGSMKSQTPTAPAVTKTGSPSNVNTTSNQLSLTTHGFATGDRVLYTVGTLAQEISPANINTGSSTITLTAHGYVTGDATTYGKGTITHTLTSSGSTVDTANNRLTITGHGMSTGTALKYVSTGGTAISGITVGYTYYIKSIDANTITLHTTVGNATAGTPTVNLTSTGAGLQTFKVDGTVAGGLTDNTTYYVIKKTNDTLQLATTAANATADTEITITSQGTGIHTLTSAGTAIAPLVTNTEYYVINIDANNIKLAMTLSNANAGTAIDFTSQGVGTFTLYRAALVGDGYYMASGGAGAGTWENITSIPTPVFRKFSSNSLIGGRIVTTGGVPVIEYPGGLTTVTSPTSNAGITFPASWTTLVATILGGGGSGSPGNQSGNSGSSSNVTFGGGLLTVTANGGQAGGLNTLRTDGGQGGTVTVTGTKASDITNYISSQGVSGTNGTANTFYKKNFATSPNQAGTGGDNPGASYTNDGSNGLHTLVADTSNPGSQSAQTGSGSINLANSNYMYTSILITLAGATGSDPTNLCGCGAVGGNGDVMVLSVTNPTNGVSGTFETGTYTGGKQGGTGGYGANGGLGGNKWGSGSNGAGGGAGTGLKIGGNLVAGAGGGGGGGGTDGNSCSCGVSGGQNNTNGYNSDAAQPTSEAIYNGGGSGGQNAGCNGGGGGGGGGGYANATITGQGIGNGGGVGAGAGHGGGYGGGRGMSAYNTTIFTKVSQNNGATGNGYISWSWNEDRSYWTNGGGGGGAGGYIYFGIDASKIGSNVTATYSVGGGGAGVGGTATGGGAKVEYGFGVITGYEGGSTNTTVGDIVIKASGTDNQNGPDIFSSGTGTGSSGGFMLPTTQVPEVEIVSGTSGGSGATATVTLANGFVNTIMKGSGGTGYTSVPEVRIKHGAGTGAYAVATVNNAQEVDTIVLSTQSVRSAYTHYVKIGGVPSGTNATDYHRWINIKEHDCTDVKRFSIKCARGNGVNGGDLPEQGGDVLKLYYNTDLSDNFPSTKLIGTLVPLPTTSEVSSKHDGDGTGTDATKWYWYSLDLPTDAQSANTRFQIKQERPVGSGSNDSGNDSDHYGICDFIYEYKEVTQATFVPTDGSISTNADELTYVVEGDQGSIYTSGATALDATFTLNSQNPLVPVPAIDPDFPVPLQEPYHVCKYLIKAF